MRREAYNLIEVSLLQPMPQIENVEEESKDWLDERRQSLFVGVSECNSEKMEEFFHCLHRQLTSSTHTEKAYRGISVLDLFPEFHDNREQRLGGYLLGTGREEFGGNIALFPLLDGGP